MTGPFPARLHVVLARKSPSAVVIRRGPTRHTAVIGWDRTADRFALGQWLYGRIYERRCDLSPDGRHFIYFAMNGRWHSRSRGSWTAISRAPWLKALTFYPKGDCWNGGGLFLTNRRYWLNGGACHEAQRDDSMLEMSSEYPWHEGYGGECAGVYYIRLQRDGWAMQHAALDEDGGTTATFDRRVNAHWKLRKLAHATVHHPTGRGCYFDRHRLINTRTDETVDLPGWEWADVDGARLVWAENGCLYAGRVERDGLIGTKLLHDFNGMRFERRAAPY
jgi:hypothetical protein